jgi:hypothetical protein
VFNSDGIVDPDLIKKYNLGSILIGGNAAPNAKGEVSSDYTDKERFAEGTLENWQNLARLLNQPTNVTVGSKTFDIYPLLGTDAVHGN